MFYASVHAYLSYHLHLCVVSNESRGPAKLETLSNGAADDGRGSHAERPLEEPVEVAVARGDHAVVAEGQEGGARGGELGGADEAALRNVAVPV